MAYSLKSATPSHSKYITQCSLVLFLFGFSICQAQQLEWAAHFEGVQGNGSAGIDLNYQITSDASSNVYMIGSYADGVDFDPAPLDTLYLNGYGGDELYIAKLSPNGNLLWAKTIVSSHNVVGRSIQIGPQGDIHIAGHFGTSFAPVDLDPGPDSLFATIANSIDGFAMKLDPNGNLLWASQLTGITGQVWPFSIVVDPNGFCYLGGNMSGVVDFDPSQSNYNVSSNGSGDAFMAKLDSNGNLMWAFGIGGVTSDEIRSLTLDPMGNVYASGFYSNTVDFDPDTSSTVLNSPGNSTHGFIAKYSPNGALLNVIDVGDVPAAICQEVRSDDYGNIYGYGSFTLTTDFGTGNGSEILTPIGNVDAFLVKYTSMGDLCWVKQIGGGDAVYGYALDVDSDGSCYGAGIFRSTADFDPDSSSFMLSSTGTAFDNYVVKLDSSGLFDWAISAGGPSGWEFSWAVHVDEYNSVYSSGSFEGMIDVDPGLDTLSFSPTAGSFSRHEHYLLKLEQCDSLNSNISIAACDSFTFNGNTFDSTGVLTYTLTSTDGCDSVVTLNLTILTASSSTVNEVACNSYTSPSGIIYSTNGIYFDTIPNSVGCDSIITINLTIIQSDTTVSQNGTTLSSNAIGVNYQWLDCSSNFSQISGANSSTFTPSQNGVYAVEITNSICVDTSSCVHISSVGDVDLQVGKGQARINPNPNNGQFVVELPQIEEYCIVRIHDVTGKILISRELKNQRTIQFQESFPAGVYNLDITCASDKYEIKLVIR